MTVAADAAPLGQARRRRARLALWLLAALLLVAVFASLGIGALAIAPATTLSVLLDHVGLGAPWPYEARDAAVLIGIRLPRTVLGILVGAGLAAAGAALQGLFRNPLADPALIGVSAGAALTAGAAIVFGAPLFALAVGISHFVVPVAAMIGGLAATVLVYAIANRDGTVDVPTMLLAGVAMNAIGGAGMGALVFASTDQQLRDLNFWLLGSLGGATWDRLLPVLPILLGGIVALPFLARALNAFLLGEREAYHLGVNVERGKRLLIALAAITASAAVALTGIIGFVGLVVPHLIRIVLGPDHRVLLPAAILTGASLMLVADLLARLLVVPAELPIGVLTACVGGPFFLWLLVRRSAMRGW